jgi:hypothetical protein
VVAVWMPRALLLQQVFEPAGVLLRVPFRRALDIPGRSIRQK